jgi:uncharacterized protein (TIGR00369 family)
LGFGIRSGRCEDANPSDALNLIARTRSAGLQACRDVRESARPTCRSRNTQLGVAKRVAGDIGYCLGLGPKSATPAWNVTITCGFEERLTQQHGLLHGGLLATLVDVACGYAALSVMPADREVLTVEFKIHFLKPAKTERVFAVGQVVQAGWTLTVCEGSVLDATRARVLARMTATMMAVDTTSAAT